LMPMASWSTWPAPILGTWVEQYTSLSSLDIWLL
jgi:hypothetical protein